MSYIIDTYDISDIHDMYDIRDMSYIHYIHYIDRRDYRHAIDRDITLPLIFNSVENLKDHNILISRARGYNL